jgi:APA family basic amino acid/polyamine antiporter
MAAPIKEPHLRRSLTLWPLVFYGLSVIVGAGIYVAIGTVVDRAGPAAPLSFLLAGVVAGATGLCYAELAGRFPEAAGAAAYVRHGFGKPWLSLATGLALALAIVVATASIASGAVHYLSLLLPLPPAVLIAGLVLLFTGIASLGVRESVGLAAGIGAIEILGLLVAVAVGLSTAGGFDWATMLPADAPGWSGVLGGAFIAFFAFIGFESLANMGEEVRDPHRTLPRGILGAVLASIALYLAVSLATVASGRDSGSLLGLFQGMGATAFAVVGTLAVANGVLVQIVVLARLIFGVAKQGQLPAALAHVHPRTRTPVVATVLAGAMVLAMALFLPFEHLLSLANLVTLAVFVLVDLALWRVQRRGTPHPGTFAVPHWLPPVAALLAALLIAAEVWP